MVNNTLKQISSLVYVCNFILSVLEIKEMVAGCTFWISVWMCGANQTTRTG